MISMTVASQIQHVANERGHSSVDLAKMTGHGHHSYWSRVLAGELEPGPDVAQRAAAALGVGLVRLSIYYPNGPRGDENCHFATEQVTKIVTAAKHGKPKDIAAGQTKRRR